MCECIRVCVCGGVWRCVAVCTHLDKATRKTVAVDPVECVELLHLPAVLQVHHGADYHTGKFLKNRVFTVT